MFDDEKYINDNFNDIEWKLRKIERTVSQNVLQNKPQIEDDVDQPQFKMVRNQW